MASFDYVLVTACAATLAGMKCGSMFSWRGESRRAVRVLAEKYDRMLSDRGVRVRVLGSCGEGTLLYVYRPAMLRARLDEEGVQAFLSSRGFQGSTPEEWLSSVSAGIADRDHFPHEIGIFLDYPLADVRAFIEKGSHECLCTGCWKAYSDPEGARRRFEKYSRCRRVYAECWNRGFSVTRLTVAA